MQHKQDYKIVSGSSPEHLISIVKDLIEQGYKCQGGVTVSEGRFYQAMVLNIFSN